MPANPQTIEKRFAIGLSPRWRDWFVAVDRFFTQSNEQSHRLTQIPLAHFCSPLTIEAFCEDTKNLWPGLTPPDCLPLTTNGYGDWLLARVDFRNQLSEVIHWFHGGGDWIPVGRIPQHALLHDVADHLRPMREQALRGDRESQNADLPNKFSSTKLSNDLVATFSECVGLDASERSMLERIRDAIASTEVAHESYIEILDLLSGSSYEIEAAVADHIENQIFSGFLEEQELNQLATAATLCEDVIRRRESYNLKPLGWAHHICAEYQLKQGNKLKAYNTFAKSFGASAFSDQSVRFGTQRFPAQYGKYSVHRFNEVASLNEQSTSRDDAITGTDLHRQYYEQILAADSASRDLRQTIFDWHFELGQTAFRNTQYQAAYVHFYDALSDLGVPSFAHAKIALEMLSESARLAEMPALHQVAEFHLSAIGSR